MRGAWCASAHSPPASCADRQSFIPGDRDHGVSRQWRYSGACAIDGGDESPRNTKLYDRTKEPLTQEEIERIVM